MVCKYDIDESLIGHWMSALDENLSEIVATLMARFSSKEGYKALDDAISTSKSLSALPYIWLFCLLSYQFGTSMTDKVFERQL